MDKFTASEIAILETENPHHPMIITIKRLAETDETTAFAMARQIVIEEV